MEVILNTAKVEQNLLYVQATVIYKQKEHQVYFTLENPKQIRSDYPYWIVSTVVANKSINSARGLRQFFHLYLRNLLKECVTFADVIHTIRINLK